MTNLLDLQADHKVEYCVPLWARDENVRLAMARRLPRVELVEETRSDPVAIACYGPSLNDTWGQIKGFRSIISCSGAHKFLLERGIVPTYHVEVDPRPHKVELLGSPHPDVEYLIASTCHPKYFDHLKDSTVRLWHVFSNEAEVQRVLPFGEWAVTGGSSVGLRALTMARFLGFTDLHVFGMDGCAGPTGKHAAAHPMQPKGEQVCEYNGVEYRTTVSMMECAKQTWHELDQLTARGVTATFYGEGLVQAMAKDYVPKPVKGTPALAVSKPDLISADYREQNAQLHRDNMAYGVGGGRHAKTVLELAQKTHANSVLDYGCGKGHLAKSLPFGICEYDPCILGKDESPRPADLVVCTDVLEHIEPDRLDLVLLDLARVTRRIGYLVIHTAPARKTLPDGRNTHLIVESAAWWVERLRKFFFVRPDAVKAAGAEVHIVVVPKSHSLGAKHGGSQSKKGRAAAKTQATGC